MISQKIRENTFFLREWPTVPIAKNFKLGAHRRVSIKSCNTKISDGSCKKMVIKPRVEWVINKQEVRKWIQQVSYTFLRILIVKNTKELKSSQQAQSAACFYAPLDKLGNKFLVDKLEKMSCVVICSYKPGCIYWRGEYKLDFSSHVLLQLGTFGK